MSFRHGTVRWLWVSAQQQKTRLRGQMGFWKRTADKLLLKMYMVDLQASSSSNVLLLYWLAFTPLRSQSSSGEWTRRTPYHWWNLSSPASWPPQASHWPPVSSRGGSSDGGEGYGFSVTVCAQQGAKSGSGAAGFTAYTWPITGLLFGPDSAQIWPWSTPKPACVQADWLKSAGLVEGVWRLKGAGCYMKFSAWPVGGESLREGTSRGATWDQRS